MSRIMLRSLLTRVTKCNAQTTRLLSSIPTQKGSKVGFESLGFSDSDIERTLITKSLAKGCKTIITKSKEGYTETYELLCDLTEDEECEPATLFLGHICTAAPSADTWIGELEDIHKVLKTINRKLDVIHIPVPAQNQWDVHSISANLSKLLLQTDSTGAGSRCKVGIDLNTALLMSLSAADVNKLTTDVLTPLSDAGVLQSLSVATNAFTYPHSATVFDWVAQHNAKHNSNIVTIATDTLRAHARRPGLMLSDYSFNILHHMGEIKTPFQKLVLADAGEKDNTVTVKVQLRAQSEAVQALVERVTRATENLNMHLNKCIHTEKVFITKISAEDAAAVPRNEIFLAQMLSASHTQIKYPEEWQYFLRTEIEPQFEAALKLFKGRSVVHDDFASLYRNLAKNMLSSFRHLLQEIALLRAQEVLELVQQQKNHSTSTTSSTDTSGSAFGLQSSLPCVLANFTADWTGAQYVTVAHTTVDVNKWGDAAVSPQGSSNNSPSVGALYRDIRAKLDEE